MQYCKSIFAIIWLAINAFAFSGSVTQDTTWASDAIITGNVTVNTGVTLTISPGVKVQTVWVDNNADLIGDVLFTVNGKLNIATGSSPVAFQSYDRKNSRQAWMGLVLSGPKQTVSGFKIRNAWRGLSITAASDTNRVSCVTIDSCLTGVYLDSTNDTTELSTIAVRNGGYGIVGIGSKGIYANELDLNRNDSGGVLLTKTTARLTNALVYLNNMFGVKIGGNGTLTMANAMITGNTGYGLFVDTVAIANASLCNIVNNKKPGILVTSNTPNALHVSASNIYGNSGSLPISEDLNDVVKLNCVSNNGNGWFKLPIYTSRVIIESNHCRDAGYNIAWAAIGLWTTNCGNYPLVIPLTSDSIHLWHENVYDWTKITAYGFTHPHQLLYLTATRNVITATDNWWGQLSSIDTLIGTQTLVTWSDFRTSAVTEAGSINTTQRIAVSKLSHTFTSTAVAYSDSVKLTIANSGGSILQIDSVGASDTCFRVRHQKSMVVGGEYDTVTITFKPISATAYSTYLNITCNDPTQPLVQIYLAGNGVPFNYRPHFIAEPTDTICIAGDPFTRTVTAQDSNITDVLTYSLLKAPAGLTIVSATGIISWTPALTATTDSVVIRTTDQLGLADTCRFKLTIAHRPIFTTAAPTDTLIAVGATWDFDVNATDVDNHAILFSLDSLRGSMIISATSGLIHYIPTVVDTGRFRVVVRATDPLGASATQKFFLYVGSSTRVILNSHSFPQTFCVSTVSTTMGAALQIAVPAGPATRGVEIHVVNLQGKTVRDLSGTFKPGWHLIQLDNTLAGGLYLFNVRSQEYARTIRFTQR
jgi:hypothetical protein